MRGPAATQGLPLTSAAVDQAGSVASEVVAAARAAQAPEGSWLMGR